MKNLSPEHMLIFEPRTVGHHLSWLRYITEDLLSGGFKLTLAVDYRPKSKELIDRQLSPFLRQISILSVFDEKGEFIGGGKLRAAAECLKTSGAQEVFFNNFDEVASNCLRMAAIGLMPPEILRGRLNGVYFRPRFLANKTWPLGNLVKAVGFRNLCRNSWLKNIYLMDENFIPTVQTQYAGANYYFLPDPWSGNFSHDKKQARKALGIPAGKRIFLNYGIGTRRKGLHLIIRALLNSTPDPNFLLLCAGKITDDKELVEGLEELQKRGVAKVLDRYVSDAEEELCFSASDVVLLPYVKHFGSSGVLSRAAAAGKMVVASDEGLVADRVKKHNLGWLFRSESVEDLRERLEKAMSLREEEMIRFGETNKRYAESCSRDAFRKALLASFGIQ